VPTRKSQIACDRSYFSDKNEIKKKKTKIAANIVINANTNDQLDLISRNERRGAHRSEAEETKDVTNKDSAARTGAILSK